MVKLKLSILVVFSSVISYLLVPNVYFDIKMVSIFFFAGLFVTFSANAINQILEKDSDAKMNRTASRPVASGRMSEYDATIFAIILAFLGAYLFQHFFNWTAAILSLLSLVLYSWVYTPMKKVNSFSVIVGAFPGAFPCLIGWIAGDDNMLNPQAWVLFIIQFFWQFPHFWSIAWISHKDYVSAGFNMLPSKVGPSKFTAMQSILYSMVLIPISFLPYYLDIAGQTSIIIMLLMGFLMFILSVRLYKLQTKKEAKSIMFASYIYLLVTFIALLIDKN